MTTAPPSLPTHRRVWRRPPPSPSPSTQSTPLITLVTEPIPSLPLTPTSLLLKVHSVALNYRDANISHSHNPWPVIPRGIIGNDAACTVIATGSAVRKFRTGDRVAPNTDTKNLTGKETERSWVAADEDGVLGEYLVFEEGVLAALPSREVLSWREACCLPCAGVTAWSAVKGCGVGDVVLVQGTGGVSMFALKLARAAGARVILTSSSDKKLADIRSRFSGAPVVETVNYATSPNWHEDVLRLTNGEGVDLVVENGGPGTLLQSIKCTRRGGVVSQVGYLTQDHSLEAIEVLSLLIDRRVVLRGINAGSVADLAALSRAVTATQMRFDDIIDSVWEFDKADEALDYVWGGKQVGKVVIHIAD